MFFECGADLQKLRITLRHQLLQFDDGLRRPNTGYYVFALRVDQEFAIKLVHTVRRVTGKCDARSGSFPGIAIDHRLHIDRGSPFLRDVIFPAVNDGAIVHPRAKDGAGRALQLLPWIIRKALSGAFFHERLEAGD